MEHLDILDDAEEWLSLQPENVRTHSEKCHSWHPVCLVSRLCDEIKKLREINDALGATIVFKDMTIRELRDEQ